MFSHGNFLILLILLKCSSLLKFLLAEDTTTLATLSTIPTTNLVDNNNSYELTNHSTTYYNGTLLTSTTNPAGSVNLTSHGDEKNFHMAIQDKEKTVKRNERSQSKVTATDVPELLPQAEALFGIGGGPKKSASNRGEPQQPRGHQIPPPATIPNPGLPVFPDRPDAVYFIVAVIGGAKTWGRTLARTLLDMGPPFGSSMGPPLRPIYIDLPHNGRFSVKVLTSLCQQSDGIPLAGIVVIGDGQSARAVALSGNAMKVPVLWAKGGTANIHGLQREAQTTLQAMLMPSAKEILEAIRALFLQTHWYSFFILSDVGATMVLAGNEGSPLKESPLTPRILPLPAGNGDVFRQLAQISRSTRGIVLLLCDLMAARKIMTEAKRLNMAGGHFIWVWADTSSTTEFFDIHQMPPDMAEDKLTEYPQDIKSYKTDSDSDSAYGLSKHYEEFVERKMDFEDMDPMRRGKVDQRQPDRPRNRQKQQNHSKQERGPIRKPIQPVSESNGAGRYIFGLKRNHEESDEIKYFKEKRNPNEDFNEDFDEKVSNEDHYEDVTDEDGVQNDNTEDFPVGLLALRPVRMPVDRHFIRSTIRLFASTWFKVEQDAEREEEIRSKFRSNNYFVASDNLNNNNNHNYYYENLNNNPIDDNDHNNSNNNWWSRDRSRDQERITISQTHRRTNTLSNSNNHRNRKRRSSKDGNTKINNDNNNNTNNLNNKTSIVYNSDHTINDNSRNIINKISENVAFSVIEQQLSSDLNGSLQESLANSSNNQNLSGLNLQKTINNESNTLNNSRNTNNTNYGSHTIKTKRYNTWWASKDRTRQRQRQMQRQQQLPTNQQFLQYHQQTSYQRPMPGSERYRTGAPHYTGGCFGTPSRLDVRRSENFAKALRAATTFALSGQQLLDGSYEKPLATNFELLNLVPNENVKKGRTGAFPQDMRYDQMKSAKRQKVELTKWRRVGLISGTNVQLDTIVWPGGDIVVSGLSAHSRTVFRIVTALAPPFVMESELDEDGLCLRGLPCHRLSPSGHHNLTLMFNAIETRDRLEEDAAEHGIDPPPQDASSSYDHSMYKTKCCYGLSMDLLSNIATELSFEFHLYIVRDELFGSRFYNFNEFMQTRDGSDVGSSSSSSSKNTRSSDTVRETSVNDKDQNRKGNLQAGSNNNNKKVRERMQQDKGNYYSASFERKSNLNKDNAEQPLREGGIRAPYVVDWQDKKRRKDSRDHDSRDRSSEHGEDDDEGAEEDIDDEGIDVEEDDYESNQDNEDYGYQHHNHHHLLHHHRKDPKAKWNGIIGDLISGSADMSFAPLSVSRARAEAIDFSVPYFHSGVSLLAAPQSKSEIPLLAFLLPFSPELWIAIFTSLNVTAVAVAIYEWLSPFGLNPWGRQRSKNFSMSSALWVMWGLLCGHLVAFKAPKSWPNKFLINVWGGFSVIFIASYTANIAALIAGLFFHNASNRYDVSLLTQRVGAPIASAAESYIQQKDRHLWEHMKKYTLTNFEDGIRGLKNGSLDLIMADTPILDYYRATDPGCTLQKIGDTFVDDTYAVGMTKGFPLKDSISALIAKYSSNGYLDILTEKWYGGLPCFKSDIDIVQPRPLGVEAVAGVFLLLGLGVVLGILILIFEHLFYKYTLPILRHKPKGTVWKSRNIMFFSQKLYRFINCVELVSPHHAARELVHTLRQGQIASLFQKSIKRKEDEQRRRRKSKAQFFEMIQEIRRQQQEERANPTLTVVTEVDTATENQIAEGHKPKSSPKPKLLFANRKDSRARSNSSTLNVRRFSTDSILSERLDTIGRRLSRDLTNSPPDFGRRFETFGKNSLSVSSKFDTFSGDKTTAEDIIEETKFDTYSGKGSEKPPLPVKKHLNRRTPLNSETFVHQEKKDQNRSKEDLKIRPLPVLKEGLVHPICQEDNTKAILRDQLHEELRSKYGEGGKQRAERRVKQKHTTQVVHKSRSTDRMQPKHNRQRSLDNLDQRPPIPSPRISRTDNDVSQAPALPPKVSARTIKPRSLDRLDHDNDNFYSGRVAQDYFGRSKSDRKSEPP